LFTAIESTEGLLHQTVNHVKICSFENDIYVNDLGPHIIILVQVSDQATIHSTLDLHSNRLLH
jgi:hypothetical protein